jgi:hypothetical protein
MCMKTDRCSETMVFLMLDVIGTVAKISDALPLQQKSQQVDTIKRTITIRDEK